MAKLQNNKQPARRNKIVLWVAAVLAALAVIFFLVPLLQSFLLRTSLETESKQVLIGSRLQKQITLNQQIDLYARSLKVAPKPIYDITYNSCYTDTSDSGWVANNYNYNCLLTKYALFEVANDSTLKESIDLYAKPAAKELGSGSTDYYGNLYYLNTDFIDTDGNPYDFPFRVYIVKNNTYTNVRSVLAVDAISHTSKVVAYASDDEVANRSKLDEHGKHTLDSAAIYVVLQSNEEYFRKNIGCRIPSVIFCDSPI